MIDGRKNFLSAIRFDARSGSLLAIGQGGTLRALHRRRRARGPSASDDVHGDVRGLINDTARNRLIAFGTGGMMLGSTDSGSALDR